MKTTTPNDASLLDVLIDGFEKNEVMQGYHWRDLPMADALAARMKCRALCDEARRWKGEPHDIVDSDGRYMERWSDLEIRQAGAGIMVRVRAPSFGAWWHNESTWRHDPMGAVWIWLREKQP